MGIARAALRCDLVTTAGGLERLAEPWERLRAESPRSTPFQSPAWLIAWWNAFHPGALSTFAFHDGGRLLGVAPLFVQVRPRDGVRQLVPLGIGNTDYLDVVAAPGRGADVAAALWDALDDAGSEVGECDFPQLPPWSPLIAASEPARWSLVRGPGEPCPVVPLEGDADWPAVVPVGYRRRIRKYGRQSARVGAVAVQRAADGPEALALELMDEFIRLHAAAWAPR